MQVYKILYLLSTLFFLNKIKNTILIKVLIVSLLFISSVKAIDIRDNKTLRSLANKNNILKDKLINNNQVDIYLKNGAWTGKIILPTNGISDNSKVIVHRRASWETNVYVDKYKQVSVPKGISTFTYINNAWLNAWTTRLQSTVEIRSNSILRSLANKDNVLQDMLVHNKKITIYLRNGAWTGKIILPNDANIANGSQIIIHRESDWGTNVLNNDSSVLIDKGNTNFIYNDGFWIKQGELNSRTAFKIGIKLTNTESSYTIPTQPSSYTYDYDVDCNDDGILEAISQTRNYTCIYGSNDKEYTIAIYRVFPRFGDTIPYNRQEGKKLVSIKQWGTIEWKTMAKSFWFLPNLKTIQTKDSPNLKNVRSMLSMFIESGTSSTLNDWNISNWDVSSVVDMSHMFYKATNFNSDISNWDVSSVRRMHRMFEDATNFNSDISNWDISSVTDTMQMFLNATSFNSDISNWDVSSIVNIKRMFWNATSFNSDISNWDVSRIISFSYMLNGATSFNSDISNWDTSSATNMFYMLKGATSFNSDISTWDVSNVTNMHSMFLDATSFNSDISNWDTSSVKLFNEMFMNATSFSNHNLSNWDVSSMRNNRDFSTNWGSGNTEPNWTY